MSNNWDHIGKNFCEGIEDGYPEYFNALTAILFISPLGLWGLLASKLKSDISRLIYIFLIYNGVGSFLYHFYGYRFYGLLDTITLNFASWFVNYLAFKSLFTLFLKNMNDYVLNSTLDFVLFLDIAFALFFHLNDAVTGKPWGIDVSFEEGFAIAQLTTVTLCIALVIIHRSYTELVIYMSVGLGYLLFAVLLWVLTEPDCRSSGRIQSNFDRYTHGLWHIFSIHSSHMIIQCLFYCDMLSQGRETFFIRGKNLFTKIIFYLFPITDCDDVRL